MEKNGVDPRAIERAILLRAVDSRWMDHIDEMDQLRRGIGLRAYGNTDPVQAYNMEGYAMSDQNSGSSCSFCSSLNSDFILSGLK